MKLRLGILVGIFMAFLSLYPQLYFQIKRGENYNGATFYYDFDESAYASYLQALIDGRPRKNSIYQGLEEPTKNETLFSIQFASAYLAAIPARILGLNSESAFLAISILVSFFASLAIFAFLFQITKNEEFSAVGTLFILLFGATAAGASILKETFGFGASAFYLTFLRRFTPAVAFPFVFLLISFVWKGLKAETNQTKILFAFLATLCFALLVFGYFFLWTTVLAWFFGLFCLSFLFQKENRNWQFWAVIFAGITLSLIPYILLLSDRNPTTDASQVLEHTRKIVFFRPTLIVGILILFLTFLAVKLKRIKLKSQTTILVISLAILPVLVFNQQIITGYSLQPMHYNMYILNYLDLLALVLLIGEVFKENLTKLKPILWLIPAFLFCLWGIVEINYATKYRYAYNVGRDEAILVNKKLAEIGEKSQITLSLDSVQGDNQSAIAPQGVLWAEHLYIGGNISVEEHQRRYFLFLYFQNRDEKWLRQQLKFCPSQPCRALIGWRINPTLSYNSSKIEETEINSLVTRYAEFLQNVNSLNVFNPTLSFVVVPDDFPSDLMNLDRWYERDSGEKLGKFTLYRVRPLK
jgi:hypothetical protein